MDKETYTLYFKGKNKYGHNYEIPILNTNLKNIDLYTSNYINYVNMFNDLPIDVINFIKKEMSYGINVCNNQELSKCFYIKYQNKKGNIKVLFNNDLDTVYIKPFELVELICNKAMSYQEFQRAILNMKSSLNYKIRYKFFKYLYDNYVKEQEVKKMIDTYDVVRYFNNLDNDNTLIASLATDKNNIIVLCKKISQTPLQRRNLAIKYKEIFNNTIDSKNLIDFIELEKRKDREYNDSNTRLKINNNFNEFKNNYLMEYEII